MNENEALLVIAHGSRREKANEEFMQQVEAIATALGSDAVRGAFLEMASPDIGDALAALVADGHERVRVLPLFLNQGKHVSVDIPHDLDEARAKFPRLDITLLPHLGASTGLIELAARLARAPA